MVDYWLRQDLSAEKHRNTHFDIWRRLERCNSCIIAPDLSDQPPAPEWGEIPIGPPGSAAFRAFKEHLFLLTRQFTRNLLQKSNIGARLR